MEKRSSGYPIHLRASGKRSLPKIHGYGAVFYRAGDPSTQYQLWPGAFERIMPTAFDEALKRGDDVRALFNHDPNLVLGRSKSETLGLAVDRIGLRYEITPVDTGAYRDLVQRLQRGDVDGSSFSFGVEREEWKVENGIEIRELHAVKLFDVGPVVFPAYVATSAGARGWTGQTQKRLIVERERIARERFLRRAQLAGMAR